VYPTRRAESSGFIRRTLNAQTAQGRFKGAKGNGTFTGKEVQWDDEYKAKGFALYEFSGNYTLPSQ
jgi:hypothetical protein